MFYTDIFQNLERLELPTLLCLDQPITLFTTNSSRIAFDIQRPYKYEVFLQQKVLISAYDLSDPYGT